MEPSRLEIARAALREIVALIETHTGEHACAGVECHTCRPDRIATLARGALSRTE